MHFGTKSYLKSTRNHTAKHALSPETHINLKKKSEMKMKINNNELKIKRKKKEILAGKNKLR